MLKIPLIINYYKTYKTELCREKIADDKVFRVYEGSNQELYAYIPKRIKVSEGNSWSIK